MKKKNLETKTSKKEYSNVSSASSIPKIKKYPSNSKLKNNQDIYDEDTNYQIESTSKLNTEEKLYPISHPPNSYVEKLEQKIQEQAKRLSDLTNYKYLCEKRIIQLNPDEIFPITEKVLQNYNLGSQKKDKYDVLYNKYTKLLRDFNLLVKNQKENFNSSEIQNNSNISNNINTSGQGMYNDEELKRLKMKNKELKEEKNKVIELLRQETLNSEEQKNLIAILQQTIDNDLLKTGGINKYVTAQNVVDFSKLKSENDNYRKQLVLSQALVNSLKAEIEQLNGERDKNISKMLSEKDKENDNSSVISVKKDNDILLSENISLKTTINTKNQIISNLTNEITNLKNLIEEAENKINQNVSRNNEIDQKIKDYEGELDSKRKEINEYETKFDYFNDYVSNIKMSFTKLQSIVNQYINIYNKMANEDLNSLLTKTFSENIMKVKNKFDQLKKIEKYSLDSSDTILHNIIMSLLKVVNNEFILIYEKVFESNKYYQESSRKVENLENEIKTKNDCFEQQNQNLNELTEKIDYFCKENDKMKNLFEDYNKKNLLLLKEKDDLKKQFLILKKEKDNLVNISQILIRISNGSNSYGKLYQEAVSLCETITKLEEEKSHVQEKLDSLKSEGINNKGSNVDLFQMVKAEQNTLVQLYNEFQKQIEQKEQRLNQIKQELSNLGSFKTINNKPILSNREIPSALSNRMEINTLDSNIFSSRTIDNNNYNSNNNEINEGYQGEVTDYDFDVNQNIQENDKGFSSNGIGRANKPISPQINELINDQNNNGSNTISGAKFTYEISNKGKVLANTN